MKELKIKGALSKDFQQIYIDDQTTNLFVNEDGKFKTDNIIPDVVEGSLEVVADKKIKLNAIGDIDLISGGNTILDSVGDITLSPAGRNVYMDNGTTTTFDFNTHTSQLKIMDVTDTADFCTIDVGESGATTITTVDDGAAVADLTLDADGDIILNANDGKVSIKDGSSFHFFFDCDNTRFTIYDDTDSSDWFFIEVGANGATQIATYDAVGTVGHLTLAADGDIILDSASGKFIAKEAGAEFSVANSAYAGMILGYKMIGEDTLHDSYTLTTSLVVPDSDMTVRFEAPPSGAVEVMVQVYFDGNMGRSLLLGLSDNATYNTIGVTYETLAGMVDETDQQLVTWRVVVTGLTAGDTYNYWLGASANGGYLTWGGTSSLRYADFIMKVTALPTAVADYAVYG